MTRPDSIKIGPFEYTILFKEDMDPFRELVGMSHHDDLEIWIKELSELKMREVLVHEIIHCILHVYGGAPQPEDVLEQESAVTALGFGWLQIVRDNPHIVDWIREV